ncbi:hypothetical protein FHW16_000396 [Phyllobacterium myrsinacearum]|uniref:Uncharacterized protein n=1 Tax=Phyllobacterium myrsinacearum TaxID=28101 RepID=A0A839EGK1_9HYPH|nr:hypothetical protein [Phyllobacterium myrsinacearum]
MFTREHPYNTTKTKNGKNEEPILISQAFYNNGYC